MNNPNNPIARQNGLVVQEMPDEVLVYDLDTNKAHCLNGSAALVWKSCDGNNTVADIVKQFESNGSGRSQKILYGSLSTNLTTTICSRAKLLLASQASHADRFSRRSASRRWSPFRLSHPSLHRRVLLVASPVHVLTTRAASSSQAVRR